MGKTAAIQEPLVRMNREEYRAWTAWQAAGRFERVNGVVVAIAPERASHNGRKMLAWLALHRAVSEAGLACHVYGDGMTVEVDDSDYEPDVVLHRGPSLPDDALVVPDPLVIVDVLSPSTGSTDRAWKRGEHFRLTSLRHYLIVWADKPQIVHHRRSDDGSVETAVLTGGTLRLDPPGVTIAVADIYGGDTSGL
jgi:Uma2 family endonuclease